MATATTARRTPLSALARDRLAQSIDASRQVFAHRSLRNIELSLLANWSAEHAYLVALGVYAYRQGGVIAVGLLGLGRLLPAGAAALVASAAADRYPRDLLLRSLYLVRGIAALASAVAFFAGAAPIVVLVLGGSVTVLAAALRPAYWALLPTLASTPEQLTASNVIAATIEGVALLAGPALGGIVLSSAGPGHVFVLAAVLFLCSSLFATGISSGGHRAPVSQGRNLVSETVAGLRAVVTNPPTRLLVGAGGAQTFVRGALSVLIVVTALELLETGDAGVGWLSSAFGVGNLVGAVFSLVYVGRRRLGGALLLGLVMWGLPIALVAAWPAPVAAFVLLALPGLGNAIFDVGLLTLLQRTTPDDVLGRVFGILETVVFACMAAGSIAAGALVAAIGVRGALVAIGLFLPVFVVLIVPAVRRIDDRSEVPEHELRLVREISIFAPLPAVSLEHLAAAMTPAHASAGSIVFAQGDAGDRFYVVADGLVEVLRDGRKIATLDRGGFFGEMALVSGEPRMASVRAVTDTSLFALERDDFLAAISRYEQSARATADEMERRRAQTRPPATGVAGSRQKEAAATRRRWSGAR